MSRRQERSCATVLWASIILRTSLEIFTAILRQAAIFARSRASFIQGLEDCTKLAALPQELEGQGRMTRGVTIADHQLHVGRHAFRAESGGGKRRGHREEVHGA